MSDTADEMQTTSNEKIAEENETNNISEAEVSESNIIYVRNKNGCSERKSMSPEGGEGKKERKLWVEDIESATQVARSIYPAIAEDLESNACGDYLRDDLESIFPGYCILFSKWRNDLEKADHGIVVTGETSSGKSTLINKILGIKLFKGKLAESTSTICKIRNSKQIKIITTNKAGEINENDFSNRCNLSKKEDVRILRNYLKKRTNVTHKHPDLNANLQTVDILLPVPFLKGNTILVDTPGIGGSGKVTQKLIEYLPNALAFIFVIDVSSAGGMQRDRLPEILQKITDLQKQTEMPCFDPKNVVFITNKWDLVKQQIDSSDEDDEDDSDKEEESEIFKEIKMDIKKKWPLVRERNIFQMILKDVSSLKRHGSTTPFKEFQKILASLVRKAEGLRVVKHLSFLQDILKIILKGIKIRTEMVEKSKEEQDKTHEKNEKEIADLKTECTEVKKKYEIMVENDIKAIIQECETYMSTDEGKHSILNPASLVSIAKVNWNKTNFEGRIKSRVDQFVKEFLESDSVVKRYENIVKDLQKFYNKAISSIRKIEDEPVDINPLKDKDTESWTYLTEIGLILSPLWAPAIGFGLGLTAVIVAGCVFAVSSYIRWTSKTTKEIDDEYKKCKNTVPTVIRTDLQKRFATPVKEMVESVTKYLLNRIKKTEEIKKRVWEKREQIEANRKWLSELDVKMRALEETVTNLRQPLEKLRVQD